MSEDSTFVELGKAKSSELLYILEHLKAFSKS